MSEEKKGEDNIAGSLGEIDEVVELKSKIEKLEKEKAEYLAGWQRAKADFVNHKKDELKRLEEIARYGSEELIYELITVMDNFDLGLAALEKSGPVEKGIYMIRAQIADILKKRGLEKIEIKIGNPFNPEIAEAISEVESKEKSGTIVEEIEPGYRLHGKILRASRVKISKSQQ